MVRLSDKKTLEQNALIIRKGIVRAIISNKGGHIGGSLDLADMLSVVYTDFMRLYPMDPNDKRRDFMIFSKGHAGPAYYSSLAFRGIIPYDRLDNLNNPNSLLPGHCDRVKVPGVDATTGSLGQGLSIACGVALGAKIRKTGKRVFCVIGDGESAEGQIWEAAQFAAHYKLDNLITFLDWNNMQIDGTVKDVMDIGNPVKKFEAFGWNASLVKGDDVIAIQTAVNTAIESKNSKPSMIVLKTLKGRGAKCIEELPNSHCIAFTEELREKVIAEFELRAKELGMEDDV